MKSLIIVLALTLSITSSYAKKKSPLILAVQEVEAHVKDPDRTAILAIAYGDPLIIERYNIVNGSARSRLRSWISEHWALRKKSDFRAYFEAKGIRNESSIVDLIIEAWVNLTIERKVNEDELFRQTVELERWLKVMEKQRFNPQPKK